ncbi:MAG TPA: NAD(+) diphosphatase [Solirubrobacteraceae bacterium]|nr:NAD(+) diphosphatase [Solirubrobacteraceae bacterium]
MWQASEKIAFAGGALDRAVHLREDGGAERLRGGGDSRVVLVGNGQEVAVTGELALALVPVDAVPDGAELTFLGLDSGAALFAHDAAAGAPETCQTVTLAPLRGLADELEPAQAALAAYAVGLIGWHRVQRYCGRCASATVIEAAGHRRHCPVCGLNHFPRTDPAITMLVQAADRCLLSRRRGAPENRWSALAGFVEPGETPEEAVIREAREETGVEVVWIEYVASQPWPFPQALMIGFWAFVDPDTADGPPTPDAAELVDARWWGRDELAGALGAGDIVLPPPGTIGNYLISTWLAGGAAPTP